LSIDEETISDTSFIYGKADPPIFFVYAV